jgi:hypothetical protein
LYYINFFVVLACPASYTEWIGDGSCDDATNNEACQFDGGDCCLDDIVLTYCTICLCDKTGIQATLAPGGM